MSESSVFDSIKSVTGTPYHRSEHNKDILDMVVLRRARERNIRLPTATELDVFNFHGAKVFKPTAGINRNVIYLDLASLYPNGLRELNVGPDTIVGTQEELEASEWTESDCVWSYIDTREVKHLEEGESWRQFTDGGYKMIYDPNGGGIKWSDDPQYERCYYLKPSIKEGFLRDIVGDLIEMKYQYEGGLYEAVKRVVNSIYGFVAAQSKTNSSRLADWRLGESITLAGRKVIDFTADSAVEYFDERVDGEVYISHGDTDGVGIAYPEAPTRDAYLRMAKSFEEWINGEGYAEFMNDEFGVETDTYMEVETESYAPAVFVPRDFNSDDPEKGVRKRYAQHVTWEK